MIRWPILAGFAVLVAGAVGAAALYGGGGGGNGREAGCASARPVTGRMVPLARGEVAAVQVARTPLVPAAFAFSGPDGRMLTLEDFRGRVVLLNLWATWCVPCRKEMPALDALQARLGGPDFEVVAVNMDTRNPEKPREWLVENKITHLAYYADPAGKVFQSLRTTGQSTGLPTTVLFDREGCMLAHIAGQADWASADAVALISESLRR